MVCNPISPLHRATNDFFNRTPETLERTEAQARNLVGLPLAP